MGFNIQEMLEKARNMQQEVDKLKQQAEAVIVEGEAGAGMVKVKMNGAKKALDVSISPELLEEKDPVMLQDLIVAAFNDAGDKAQDKMQGELSKLTSMLPNIPGFNF